MQVDCGLDLLFDPVVRSMRELVSQGVVGDPVHLDIFQAYDLEGNFGKAVVQDQLIGYMS